LVRTVADRILGDAAEAEDLLQEVFLFIFRKWALFDASRGSARSWIVQVTYHRAIDRRRHLASRHFYANAELDETLLRIDGPMADSAFYERSIEGSLGTEMLSKIAEALSIDQRRTIQLYFFEGYTFEEIAELTKQMVGNVRNHYYRGLEKIRKLVFAPELRDK
jgi:RNA polymerase sigma-70 factor, ECF subfamily